MEQKAAYVVVLREKLLYRSYVLRRSFERRALPPTSHPSLGELALEQALKYGCHDSITFRLPKPLGVCIRTQALINEIEISSVIRVLLQEALEARGINWLGV